MRAIILGILCFLCAGCHNKSLHTAFTTQVCIKPYKLYKYRTCNDIDFIINKRRFTIPKKFETDLASIPKIAWPIMAPAHSSLIRPAIVHDWFYRETCDFNRHNIDLIFYHMLVNDGISKFKASIMYYSVRFFGGEFYHGDNCHGKFKELDKAI